MALHTAPRSDPEPIAGINVTPFVDIALVLLIIFMVTAKYANSAPAIPLDVPRRAPVSVAPVVSSTVQIALDRDGALRVDARPATEAELGALVAQRRARDPELRAVIAADRAAPHGRVVRAIDLVRAAGVTRFAIQTELPAPGATPTVPAPR